MSDVAGVIMVVALMFFVFKDMGGSVSVHGGWSSYSDRQELIAAIKDVAKAIRDAAQVIRDRWGAP